MYPPASGSGGGSSMDLAGDYRYVIDESTGALELWKGHEKIGIQSPDGSWFRTSVSTGTGSYHLGGGESERPSHSMSAGGQNVVFKNEAFTNNPNDQVVWFPAWQGVSASLGMVVQPTYLQFGGVNEAYTVNGVTPISDGVDYDFVSTVSDDLCIASVTARAHETVNERITNVITSAVGVELHKSSKLITVAAGNNFTIEYPSLYFARRGDELRLQMLKEDGTPLKVRAGGIRTNEPWRTLRCRVFVDMPITGAAIGDTKFSFRQADHNGWVAMNGRSVSTLSAVQRQNLVDAGINWSTVPNTQGRVTMASGGSWGYATLGGSYTISQASLPNVGLSFNVTSGNASAGHTHSIDPPATTSSIESQGHVHRVELRTLYDGAHVHTYDRQGSRGASGNEFTVGNGSNTKAETTGQGTHSHELRGDTNGVNQSHTHTVDIAAFTSGGESNSHTHNVSGTTASMNGGFAQSPHVQPYIAITQFVYVGM